MRELEEPPTLSDRQSGCKFDLSCACATLDKLGPTSIAFVMFVGLFHETDGYRSWYWRQERQLI